MTRRERMEARAARRLEWAASREKKAAACFSAGDSLRDPATGRMDWAFVTQPGYIPERARINRAHERGAEHAKVATHHEQRAAGIADQLERSIFSDDADAVPALEAKLAALESTRARMTARNKAYRKGDAAECAALGFDLEKMRADVASRYSWEQKGPHRPYELSNLGGQISQCKKRIVEVRARQDRTALAEAAGGVLVERFPGCESCRVTFPEYPGREATDALKAARFYFSGGSWTGPFSRLPECCNGVQS